MRSTRSFPDNCTRTPFWRLLSWMAGDLHANRICKALDVYCMFTGLDPAKFWEPVEPSKVASVKAPKVIATPTPGKACDECGHVAYSAADFKQDKAAIEDINTAIEQAYRAIFTTAFEEIRAHRQRLEQEERERFKEIDDIAAKLPKDWQG